MALEASPEQPESGVGDSRFMTWALALEAPLPAGARTLAVINANFPDRPALFNTTLSVSDAVVLDAASLFDVEDGALRRSRDGQWRMEEESRELRASFRVRSAPVARAARGLRWLTRPAGVAMPPRVAAEDAVRDAVDGGLGALQAGRVTAGTALVGLGLGLLFGLGAGARARALWPLVALAALGVGLAGLAGVDQQRAVALAGAAALCLIGLASVWRGWQATRAGSTGSERSTGADNATARGAPAPAGAPGRRDSTDTWSVAAGAAAALAAGLTLARPLLAVAAVGAFGLGALLGPRRWGLPHWVRTAGGVALVLVGAAALWHGWGRGAG